MPRGDFENVAAQSRGWIYDLGCEERDPERSMCELSLRVPLLASTPPYLLTYDRPVFLNTTTLFLEIYCKVLRGKTVYSKFTVIYMETAGKCKN